MENKKSTYVKYFFLFLLIGVGFVYLAAWGIHESDFNWWGFPTFFIGLLGAAISALFAFCAFDSLDDNV